MLPFRLALAPGRAAYLWREWGGCDLAASEKIDFLIVTALPEEREAVLALLSAPTKINALDNDTSTYYSASIGGGETAVVSRQPTRVLIMCLPGMGRVQAAANVANAIRTWSPRAVLMVGIAGGLKDTDIALGDVIIAEAIVDYELQKISAEGKEIRPVTHNADPRLLKASAALARNDWLGRIKCQRPGGGRPTPSIHQRPVASGDKVVTDPTFLAQLRASFPKLVGVEMEGAGAAFAASDAAERPHFLMIRGVSDLADSEKSAVVEWRPYACAAAAAVAISLIEDRPLPLTRGLQGHRLRLLSGLLILTLVATIMLFARQDARTRPELTAPQSGKIGSLEGQQLLQLLKDRASAVQIADYASTSEALFSSYAFRRAIDLGILPTKEIQFPPRFAAQKIDGSWELVSFGDPVLEDVSPAQNAVPLSLDRVASDCAAVSSQLAQLLTAEGIGGGLGHQIPPNPPCLIFAGQLPEAQTRKLAARLEQRVVGITLQSYLDAVSRIEFQRNGGFEGVGSGLSIHMLLALHEASVDESYILDIGSEDRNRVSLYENRAGDLVVRVLDDHGNTNSAVVSADRTVPRFTPIYLSFEIATTSLATLVTVEAVGGVFAQVRTQPLAIDPDLTAVTIGADRNGASGASFSLGQLLVYHTAGSVFLRNEIANWLECEDILNSCVVFSGHSYFVRDSDQAGPAARAKFTSAQSAEPPRMQKPCRWGR